MTNTANLHLFKATYSYCQEVRKIATQRWDVAKTAHRHQSFI